MRWLPLLLLACNDASDEGALVDFDGDGVPAERDCDDRNPGIYPGATDNWYDGIDSDCDGRDDYDQDEDGARWEAHGGADCDDLDPAIGPHAEEIPYDLVDNDCDASTLENDLDGDGSRHPLDCDDRDPAVGDGFDERFGDGVDEDCDGQIDGTVLAETGHELTSPRHLRVATDPDGEPVLVFAAEEIFGHDGAAIDGAVGVAMWPTREEQVVLFHGGEGTNDAIGSVAAVADEGALWFAASSTVGATGNRRLSVHRFQAFGNELLRTEVRTVDADPGSPWPLTDVALDRAGEPWAVMGGEEGVAWLGGALGVGGTRYDADVGVGVAMLSAVPPMPFMSCDDQGCEQWATDQVDGPPVPVGGPPLDTAGRTLVRGGDMLLLTDASFGALVHTEQHTTLLFREWPLLQGAGWTHDGVLYAGGVSTDDLVVVTWGNPDFAEPATTQFAMPHPDWEPTEVAVWADDDRFVIAVLAHYAPAKPELLQDRLMVRVLDRADF